MKNSKPDYSVVTCFIECEGKVLILKRAKNDAQFGLWGIPGGKLEKKEFPEEGLLRELHEELGFMISKDQVNLLDKIHLKNPCDGHYLLYLYYMHLEFKPEIRLTSNEHSKYQWVSIENFKKYPLLFCQGTAFDFVKDRLMSKIQESKLCLIA